MNTNRSRMEVSRHVEKFLYEWFRARGPIPAKDRFLETDYLDSGLLDSLSVMPFILALEEQFNVELNDEVIVSTEFRTISGVIAIVSAMISEAGYGDDCVGSEQPDHKGGLAPSNPHAWDVIG